MTAETVSVGTELLLGDTVDSNSAELGRVLARFGVVHLRRQTVGDNLERLVDSLKLALSRSDMVFTIGGLGPTQDDLTRDGIASALGVTLVLDQDLDDRIRAMIEGRGLAYLPNQSRQAMRPEGSKVLPNPNGTAPGLICSHGGKTVVAMPGPPREFLPMLHGPVSELLQQASDGVLYSRIVRVIGVGESAVEKKLEDLMAGSDPTVAPYAKTGEVHVRVTSKGSSAEDASSRTDPVVKEIAARLGTFVYGYDQATLELSVLALLREKAQTVAVAESCTGGGLGKRLTSVAGASDAFLGGVVSYSNGLKVALLGVSEETLRSHGAVSEECAREMAMGVVNQTGADWGVSVTGIAGPDGGTADKPVGLVYTGVAGPGGVTVDKYVFPGTRESVRERSETWALQQLRRRLLKAG